MQWALPLAISLMMLVVLVSLAWWAYIEMARSLRQSAHERLEIVSTQLAQSLQASVERSRRSVQQRADTPAVRAFLGNPTPANRAAAVDAITYRGTRPESHAAFELLDARGHRVLVTGPDSNAIAGQARRLVSRTSSPGTNAVGSFHALNDSTVVVPAMAMVTDGGRRLGYVVEWHHIRQTPAEREVMSRLLGPGARFTLGGRAGVWTDQVTVQPPPHHTVRAGGGVASYEDKTGPQLAMLTAVPSSPWLMLIEFPEKQVLAPAVRFRADVLRAALVLLVISFGAAWLISRRLTAPLQELTVVQEAIARGDYTRRAHIGGPDELARLGTSFNMMTDRVEQAHADLEHKVEELRTTREQFVRAQRMEAVGQLAGGVAHDFNNLLTVILAESDFALREENDQARKRSIAEIKRAGERAAELTQQLLAFSRRQLFAATVFNVPEMVHDMERMLTRLLGDNIKLTVNDQTRDPHVRADKGQVEQVLVNLIVNARDAMPSGGRISVEIRNNTLHEDDVRTRDDVAAGEYVVISVSDTGTGIPEDVMAHIFEPFYTTKEFGRGTGLGLAVSYGIIKQSGGYITAYSENGLGTTMRVYLPAVHEQPPAPVQHRPAHAARGTETILLVEDDPAVRQVACRILQRQGYLVLEAGSGEEGVELLETYKGGVDLVLTDVVLPGMGGRDVAERAAELRPGVKVLFTSGYTDDVILQQNLMLHESSLIGKPFTVDGLARGVREALDG